ncbi:uncharacterized protein DMENIID0001_069490 [Sergentomyia squamirostris]
MTAYHPCPESDYSDSDSEFDFAFPRSNRVRELPQRSERDMFLDTLENAVKTADLETVKECFSNETFPFGIDETFPRSNWTCLLYACSAGNLECVRFLVEEKGANVNLDCDSMTPLILACNSFSDDGEAVLKVVEFLLEKGTDIKKTDNYGWTPLIYACRRGFSEVVQKLLGMCDPETIDSSGRTALFHAIECCQKNIVVILLDYGVCKDVKDFRGFTPKRLAEYHNYTDLVDLIPRDRATFNIPTHYLTYTRLPDILPGLIEDSDVPAFFPDLKVILYGMDCESFLNIFAARHVSLEDFLSLNENTLREEYNIRLPFVRKKLLHGIYLFHNHDWNKKSLPRIRRDESFDMFDLFKLCATKVKHMVVLKSTYKHICNNRELKFSLPTQQTVASCRYALQELIQELATLRNRVTYIQSFNPKPILNIDHDALLKKRMRERRKKFLMYSVVAVITVFVIRTVRAH